MFTYKIYGKLAHAFRLLLMEGSSKFAPIRKDDYHLESVTRLSAEFGEVVSTDEIYAYQEKLYGDPLHSNNGYQQKILPGHTVDCRKEEVIAFFELIFSITREGVDEIKVCIQYLRQMDPVPHHEETDQFENELYKALKAYRTTQKIAEPAY